MHDCIYVTYIYLHNVTIEFVCAESKRRHRKVQSTVSVTYYLPCALSFLTTSFQFPFLWYPSISVLATILNLQSFLRIH